MSAPAHARVALLDVTDDGAGMGVGSFTPDPDRALGGQHVLVAFSDDTVGAVDEGPLTPGQRYATRPEARAWFEPVMGPN